MITVNIKGKIAIDDVTAEILEYITGYDLKLKNIVGNKYSEVKIRESLATLRDEVRQILKARDVAIKAVRSELTKKGEEA